MMRTQAVSAVLLAVIIDGCSHCYYVSNVQHVPLFREQGEVQFAVSYSEGEDITKSFGGQVAGSLTNHLGLMGSFFYTTGGMFPKATAAMDTCWTLRQAISSRSKNMRYLKYMEEPASVTSIIPSHSLIQTSKPHLPV